MKYLKLYSLSLAIAGLAACNGNKSGDGTAEQKDTTLLPTNIVDNPRSADGANVDVASMPTMDFKDTMHDFGNIKDGEVVMYDFEFTNNGKTALIIAGATGSCGCTVPTYPRDPIAPGKSEVLKVRFDSKGKSGHQEKTVDIKTNSFRGDHKLVIKAEVAAAKTK